MIEIHFLPYGRVDAILIGVDGHWAFVDGGYRRDGVKAVKYMREIGIERLDAYIVTHRHRNHVGAGPVVIKEMQPGMVYTCHPEMRNRLYGLCTVSAEKVEVNNVPMVTLTAGYGFRVGGAVFTYLGPDKLKKCSAGAYGENQNSIILQAFYKGRSVLLTGDTSAGVLDKSPDRLLKGEVLKNPHHNGALGEKLLKKIGPKFTVVCNGKPPAKYYRQRLKSVGSKLFTAGKKGDGLVILEGNEMGWKRRDNGGET